MIRINTDQEKEAAVREYLQTQFRRNKKERDTVLHLLCFEPDNHHSHSSFLDLWMDDTLAAAIRDTVISYTNDKSKAIRRFQAFISWLSLQTGLTFEIDWPPIDTSNGIERMLWLLKLLQELPAEVSSDPESTVLYLSEKMWLSTELITDMLHTLRDEDSTEALPLFSVEVLHRQDVVSPSPVFLDQPLRISGMQASPDGVSFQSTVHPVLLMENLTCVVVLLQSLLEKAEDPLYSDWAMLTAGKIWGQLTDYAKERVSRSFRNLLQPGSRVFARFDTLLESAVQNAFVTEDQIHENACAALLFCLKAGEPCRVLVRDESGSEIELKGVPVPASYNRTSITLLQDNGEEYRLLLKDVISSVHVNSPFKT